MSAEYSIQMPSELNTSASQHVTAEIGAQQPVPAHANYGDAIAVGCFMIVVPGIGFALRHLIERRDHAPYDKLDHQNAALMRLAKTDEARQELGEILLQESYEERKSKRDPLHLNKG